MNTESILGRCTKQGDCLVWTGKIKKGQCLCKHEGRLQNASKLLVYFQTGTKPDKVFRTCFTPACMNIEHFAYTIHGNTTSGIGFVCKKCGMSLGDWTEGTKPLCGACKKSNIKNSRTAAHRTVRSHNPLCRSRDTELNYIHHRDRLKKWQDEQNDFKGMMK